jgi:hypothetical protein
MQILRSFWVILIIGLLAGCELVEYGGAKTPAPDPTPTPVIETVSFAKLENGDVQFKTNDSVYRDPDGSTLWKLGSVSDASMISVVADVAKISGVSTKGFGIVFCAQDDQNFLAILIDIDGFYLPIRVVANVVEDLDTSWKFSEALLRGYNITNRIEVIDAGSNAFNLRFNNNDVETFSVKTEPFWTGGRYGYIAAVANNEDFPLIPVDVRFRQITPPDIGFASKVLATESGLIRVLSKGIGR